MTVDRGCDQVDEDDNTGTGSAAAIVVHGHTAQSAREHNTKAILQQQVRINHD